MKAIAVKPGIADSVHLADLSKPSVGDVPGGRGVLVKVLRVGVDGTDKEINAGEYGAAPEGYDSEAEPRRRVSISRSAIRARCSLDFTVATDSPSASAACSFDSSSTSRSTSTAR